VTPTIIVIHREVFRQESRQRRLLRTISQDTPNQDNRRSFARLFECDNCTVFRSDVAHLNSPSVPFNRDRILQDRAMVLNVCDTHSTPLENVDNFSAQASWLANLHEPDASLCLIASTNSKRESAMRRKLVILVSVALILALFPLFAISAHNNMPPA